jgi:CDP-ribitol ribitolphosphotransferase
MKVRLAQSLKNLLQALVLRPVYWFYRRRPVRPGLIIFADGHHDCLPTEMQLLYARLSLSPESKTLLVLCRDYARLGAVALLADAIRFMKLYAVADTVILRDYFLPVSSCRKRHETKVIQLWHACGAYKKFGFDAPEDFPANTPRNICENYDVVTISASGCADAFSSALNIPKERMVPLGISRTDCYFDERWRDACRAEFFEAFPQARGKKVLLWAPTYRKYAAAPQTVGVQEISRLHEALSDSCFLIQKLHPSMPHTQPSPFARFPTERLLPVADILITDYSSILFDFLLFGKPVVLFIPDKDTYLSDRGSYIALDSIPALQATNEKELASAVRQTLADENISERYAAFCHDYLSACDGHATERLAQLIEAADVTDETNYFGK